MLTGPLSFKNMVEKRSVGETEKSQSNSLLKKPLNIGFCKLNFTPGYSGQSIITASTGGNGNDLRWKTFWIGDIASCLKQQIAAGGTKSIQQSPHSINLVIKCLHKIKTEFNLVTNTRTVEDLFPLNPATSSEISALSTQMRSLSF